jgi:twinkle protein
MSDIVGDEACPQCRAAGRDRTGNHLIVFADGGKHCNRCKYTVKPDGTVEGEEQSGNQFFTMETCPTLPIRGVPQRGLEPQFMEMYEHRVATAPTNPNRVTHIVYPRYRNGSLVAYKVKDLENGRYMSVGDGKECDLVGQNLESTQRRMCIITEGEDDMVAAKQLLAQNRKDYCVVSLPNGASSKISKYSHEWLTNFDTIIIATDMDDPGHKAADGIADLFGAGVCKRAHLPYKDANECLLNKAADEFLGAINSASTMTPDGVVMGEDTWERTLEAFRDPQGGGIPFPDWLPDLNSKIYGMRTSSLDTFTSGSGSGKTQLLRELQYHLAVTHGKKVGVMSLEEPLEDAVIGQMSIAANMPLHLPDVRPTVTDRQLKEYWDETYGTGMYVGYDHFGSLEGSQLISKIRYLAAGCGCKYIVLDHLSIVVSEYAEDGDERKAIDSIMTKLKRLTQELDIWIGLVVHLRKANGTPFEEGAVPSLDDLRGSGAIKQLSNQVIAMARNQQADDYRIRNTTLVTVLKSRFAGRTGPSDLIYYDSDTGRMTEPGNVTLDMWRNGGRKVPEIR